MPSDQQPSPLELMTTNGARGRVIGYREQAEHFEEMAKGKADYKLRNQLLLLADRYHELATNLERADA